MTWTFVLPANTVPTVGTNTRIRYRFSTSDPYSYSNNIAIGLHTNTYTNPSTGQSVKKWAFTGTFDVPSGEYCMQNAYYGSIYKLETDCSDVPIITNSVIVDYLTPATYSVNPVYAFDNPSTPLQATINIITGLCYNCHEPSLGNCSEYLIRWRIAGSGGGWTYYGINQAYSTPAINITVGANGTYEYEYSGKLTSGGTWTPYVPGIIDGKFTVL